MTFIVSHAEALRRYQPVYAGAHRVPGGLPLPDDRVVTVNRGGLTWARGGVPVSTVRHWPGGRRATCGGSTRQLVHAHFGQSGPAGLGAGRRARRADDRDLPRPGRDDHDRGGAPQLARPRVPAWTGPPSCSVPASSSRCRTSSAARLLEKGYPADKVVTHPQWHRRRLCSAALGATRADRRCSSAASSRRKAANTCCARSASSGSRADRSAACWSATARCAHRWSVWQERSAPTSSSPVF